MQLQQASRKKAKIKMGLQAPSGAGKTYSALLIAYGLCGAWDKIAVIDTENHSADLYAHLGNYFVLPIYAPFTPEQYKEAIQICLKAGIQVIIIDSISHEWEYILYSHAAMPGNSYTNWNKITPRHNDFIQAILQCPCHIISTIRAKQDYVLVEKNGKQVPEKVGLKGITRDGMDYEFTLLLELNIRHYAVATKDRTGLFADKPDFLPTIETGKAILDWCNTGAELPNKTDILKKIAICNSNDELLAVYNAYPAFQESLLSEFTKRRQELLINISNNQITSPNGSFTAKQ